MQKNRHIQLNSSFVGSLPRAGRSVGGILKLRSDWNERIARRIARQENVELIDKHWDVIHFVRTEFYVSNGTVPSWHEINRGVAKEWGGAVDDNVIADLFPGGSFQVAKIAGCITIETVQDLLNVKGVRVWSIQPEQAIADAISLLAEKNIGALMVVADSTLVGVLSERDLTRKVLLHDLCPKSTPVSDAMSTQIVSVSPEDTVDECMALMVDQRFRHLPVVSAERLVGVLSMPDLVKVVVDQQRFTIDELSS